MSRLLLPTPDLPDIVRYFHLELAASGEVVMPATPFPVVRCIVSGDAEVWRDGGWQPVPALALDGPISRACRYRTTPGTRLIGAMLWPGQQARLFAIPATELVDQIWPLTALCAPACCTQLHEDLLRSVPTAWPQRFAAWLRAQAYRQELAGGRPLLLPEAALAQPVSELVTRSGLGLRQFERRFLASYGLSCRHMQRQLRYIRTLSVLMRGRLPDGGLSELALACGYYDQAQMGRDFTQLLGISPGRLLQANRAKAQEWQLLQYDRQEQALALDSLKRRSDSPVSF